MENQFITDENGKLILAPYARCCVCAEKCGHYGKHALCKKHMDQLVHFPDAIVRE